MTSNIYNFPCRTFNSDVVHEYCADDTTAIVIDNGSHTCRVGWSTDTLPRLQFRNLLAKLRNKSNEQTFFGNDITNLEDPKWTIRTQFESDVVTFFDAQEIAFDYTFSHLGIDTDGKVEHPVFLTEAVCTPNTYRQGMSELLFEGYNVPSVCYGVDSLFSARHNDPQLADAIIVNCGYQTTHVLPIVNGQFDAKHARRVNLGGLSMMIYINRLLHLKFPKHASHFNLSCAQDFLIGNCSVAFDYFEELKKWKEKTFSEENCLMMHVPLKNVLSEKDLEQKRLQAQRLKDINQKKRDEKIKAERSELDKFKAISKLHSQSTGQFKSRLNEEGLKNVSQLNSVIEQLAEKISEREQKSVQYYKELNYSSGREDNDLCKINIDHLKQLISDLEQKKSEILDRKCARASQKQSLNKRKSYASKERMRILSQLAKNGHNNNATTMQKASDDTFGSRDEDWNVYKFISKNDDESEEEQDQESLNEIEQSLTRYENLLHRAMIGRGKNYQELSLTTELIRVPEILFQPCMVGTDQAGLVESIEYVLKNYDHHTQQRMVKNVLTTGGLANLPGFTERLCREIRQILPFQTEFDVRKLKDPLLDAWHGAKQFAQNHGNKFCMKREDYEEFGAGFLKTHPCSNVYIEIDD